MTLVPAVEPLLFFACFLVGWPSGVFSKPNPSFALVLLGPTGVAGLAGSRCGHGPNLDRCYIDRPRSRFRPAPAACRRCSFDRDRCACVATHRPFHYPTHFFPPMWVMSCVERSAQFVRNKWRSFDWATISFQTGFINGRRKHLLKNNARDARFPDLTVRRGSADPIKKQGCAFGCPCPVNPLIMVCWTDLLQVYQLIVGVLRLLPSPFLFFCLSVILHVSFY
jgi:hypothetical protein